MVWTSGLFFLFFPSLLTVFDFKKKIAHFWPYDMAKCYPYVEFFIREPQLVGILEDQAGFIAT